MADLEFPYRFDLHGRTATAGRENHVRELIEQVLMTAPGERVMRPDFGSGLLALIFEPNSTVLAATTQMLVQAALQQHLGHLLQVQAVEVDSAGAALRVEVRYLLLRDQTTHTVMFTPPGAAP
jgi:phage baseplate assembly protein W